ncbi:hypothetical protein [Occallatibacter riparius]|uniref:Uncharacterized protein n=1 Tax=Occallatibacter riparius TaxID=1002689 RepID=A0A9J7BLA8_9BACT|nr:hypothetical protein [Occallatibacter riparius]UWZ83431.1 hypothetical protein MOP44_23045 [Occallatibacter riparius]
MSLSGLLMRACILGFLLFIPALDASAQTRMTVAEAEALFGNLHGDALAARLRTADFSERVSNARLTQWQSSIADQKTRELLRATADLSAFLPPPASDIPDAAPPDAAAQQAILARARAYTAELRPRLPNFTAQRTTTHYELASRDQLEQEERSMQLAHMTRARIGYTSLGAWSHDQHWFKLGISWSTVTYTGGQETRSAESSSSRQLPLSEHGLSSSGEFGSILSLLDRDAAHGSIAWHHWENGPRGLLAVFRCSVPKDQSHFEVEIPGTLLGMSPSGRTPPYQCEIAVDPTDGSIFRIAMRVDEDPDQAVITGVVVEYAPVTIGGRVFVCPVHSVGVYSTREATGKHSSPSQYHRFINDVTFTQYHLFGSESRIIPDTPTKAQP